MDIGDFLVAVAAGYRTDTLSSAGHQLLARANDYLAPLVPGGLKIASGGGQGRATFTPWIGILDPDETTSAQRGLYVVYLYDSDLSTVTLSLNQGITEIQHLGRREARRTLSNEATPGLWTMDIDIKKHSS